MEIFQGAFLIFLHIHLKFSSQETAVDKFQIDMSISFLYDYISVAAAFIKLIPTNNIEVWRNLIFTNDK